MQSVGEVMGIGRTFPESLQKAVRSLEQGRSGLNADPAEAAYDPVPTDELLATGGHRHPRAALPARDRCCAAGSPSTSWPRPPGSTRGSSASMAEITDARMALDLQVTLGVTVDDLDRRAWRRLKRLGFSDAQLAYLFGGAGHRRARSGAARLALGVGVTFKTVDTCGAEFEAHTPYHYSTYEDEDEVRPSDRPRVVILGSGPNRIGQGIEFDYCCVHASLALRAAGYETVMVNCNPETVSTDYDTSDRLYFEPLTPEDLANVLEAEQRRVGGTRAAWSASSSASGGQTPLKLAAGIPEELVLGTSPASIDLAEDRERWNELCGRLGIPQPPGGTATTGGRGGGGGVDRSATRSWSGPPTSSAAGPWRSSTTTSGWSQAVDGMAGVGGSLGREGGVTAERPVLVDRFLEDAVEVDVDAVRDATGEVVICGVMEHVEEAGVHSGDSACALPPQTLSAVGAWPSWSARPGHRRGARGAWPDQRAVRGQGRSGLRARGQPAGQPDRARSWPRPPGCRWPWWRPG